jgi:hypothetical protein
MLTLTAMRSLMCAGQTNTKWQYSGGKGARSLVTRALMEFVSDFANMAIDYLPISSAATYF